MINIAHSLGGEWEYGVDPEKNNEASALNLGGEGKSRGFFLARPQRVAVALYVGYLEFADDIGFWLPAWGSAFESGHIWGQIVVLGFLALAISGTVVWMGYEALSYILD